MIDRRREAEEEDEETLCAHNLEDEAEEASRPARVRIYNGVTSAPRTALG